MCPRMSICVWVLCTYGSVLYAYVSVGVCQPAPVCICVRVPVCGQLPVGTRVLLHPAILPPAQAVRELRHSAFNAEAPRGK